MKFKYNQNRYPPELALQVEVAGIQTGLRATLEAKIDTGAALSAAPRRLQTDLGLTEAGALWCRGPFEQESREECVCYVRVSLPIRPEIWTIERVLLVEGERFLLGRDILNRYVLHADGPRGVFELT